MSTQEHLVPYSEELARWRASRALSRLIKIYSFAEYPTEYGVDGPFTKVRAGNIVVDPVEPVRGRVDVVRFEAHRLFSPKKRLPELTKIELTEDYLDTIKERDNAPAYRTVYSYTPTVYGYIPKEGLKVSQTLAHPDFEELASTYPNFGIDRKPPWEQYRYLGDLATMINKSKVEKRKSAAPEKEAA